MYIPEIIDEIKRQDNIFVSNKDFGKITVEINYHKGDYVCDNVTSLKVNKRDKI